MAKLVWDQDGTRYIESGVSKCVLYVMNNNTYGTGVAWNGITAINESPGGADLTNLYADNIKYASLRAAETFAFGIEAFTYPDEWNECDGNKIVVDGVALGQQGRKAFGLCYKTQVGSDTDPSLENNYKLHIIYNSTASPSGRNYTTINENPDAISFSWDAESTPTPVTGDFKAVSTIVIDTSKLDNGKENANLKDLEDMLYGTDGTDGATGTSATLPDPNTVLSMMGYTGQ